MVVLFLHEGMGTLFRKQTFYLSFMEFSVKSFSLCLIFALNLRAPRHLKEFRVC